MRKRLQAEPGLRIIDSGYTSPANINYLTSLGHSIFLTDMVHDACTATGKRRRTRMAIRYGMSRAFSIARSSSTGARFDVVLLWTALDYLPEQFVAPVVAHLYAAMNPGGQVLAFFHTRSHGEETVRCRYHVTPGDDVEVQLTQQFPIQRAFTNRSIERLFAGWSGHKQFLAKDSVSEVIITR